MYLDHLRINVSTMSKNWKYTLVITLRLLQHFYRLITRLAYIKLLISLKTDVFYTWMFPRLTFPFLYIYNNLIQKKKRGITVFNSNALVCRSFQPLTSTFNLFVRDRNTISTPESYCLLPFMSGISYKTIWRTKQKNKMINHHVVINHTNEKWNKAILENLTWAHALSTAC